MKSLFSSHHRIRRIAAWMLCAWLLAVATGIANACLLQLDHARHGHLVHAEAVAPDPAPDHAVGDEALPRVHQGHQAAPASAACLNFCSAEQTGLTKTGGEVPSALAPMPDAPPQAWAAAQADCGPRPRPACADPAHAPPVSIRFVRLTI